MENRLNYIQQHLKCPKNLYNDFGGYSYRSCEQILESVKELLGESTLTISDEMVEVGGRVYVKATVTLADGDKTWSSTAYAREAESRKSMDDSQITGSASSYARKYALNGLFCIDDTKDADAINDHEKKETADEIKKDVSNQKRRETIEKKKEAEQYKNTKEYALQRYEGGMLFVKKLKEINPERDTAVMSAIDQVKEVLTLNGLEKELDEFNKLVNSKIIEDNDKIVY